MGSKSPFEALLFHDQLDCPKFTGFCNKHYSILLQGAHPLYRPPARTNLVPASDQLCEGAQHDNPNQCDYDISYADGSSSMGVHVRDNMQFISEDGERENADIVFGYESAFQ